jgi:hypothetical protein
MEIFNRMKYFSLQQVLTVLLGGITITGLTITPEIGALPAQSMAVVTLTEVLPITDLDTAQALWRTQDIKNYVFAYRDNLRGWHQDVRVRVEEGEVVEIAVSLDCDTSPCALDTADLNVYTVDGVFNEITKRMSGNVPANEPDYLDFSGDRTYGVPRQVVFDHPDMVDEEWQIMVLEFRMVEPLTEQRSLFPISPAIAVMLQSEGDRRSDAAEIIPITADSAGQVLALQEAWSDAPPAEYVIMLDFFHFSTRGYQVALQVQNSMMTAMTATCSPGGLTSTCNLADFKAGDYTVEGLFHAAQEVIDSGLMIDDFVESSATLGIDPEYAFPTMLLYDIAQGADEEWSIDVLRFAVLEE